jgi:hypothetical protein
MMHITRFVKFLLMRFYFAEGVITMRTRLRRLNGGFKRLKLVIRRLNYHFRRLKQGFRRLKLANCYHPCNIVGFSATFTIFW